MQSMMLRRAQLKPVEDVHEDAGEASEWQAAGGRHQASEQKAQPLTRTKIAAFWRIRPNKGSQKNGAARSSDLVLHGQEMMRMEDAQKAKSLPAWWTLECFWSE